MKRAVGLIGAAGIGAGLMYLFDPDRGKRRRAGIRNKAIHINHIATDVATKTQRDLRNRLRGVVCELKALVRPEIASDDVLEARVRSRMGRLVSHPHAIAVKAREGRIILSGPIPTAEVLPLVDAVATMRGVKDIENLLELQ
ncbi:MAG TPA: YtxH domain-containing protein [Pyrinomonadaceae bacterium]